MMQNTNVRKCCLCTIVVTILGSTTFVGCSSKQDDLFRRAAMRKRSDPAESVNESTPTVETPVAANQSIRSGSPPASTIVAVNNATPVPDNTASANGRVAIEVGALESRIAQLKLRDPNQFAAESISKIGKAFAAYLRENGKLPARAAYMSGHIESLSWRVELLPYLGYPNLYAQFDRNISWDMPPNDALLEYIPDEYVAIHRLDQKTNMLGVSGPLSLFQTTRASDSTVEDGLINTLLLVEANDEFAVPWTMPADYVTDPPEFSNGIGGLRSGGTLALWGTGMPTFLAADASPGLLAKAVTIDDGYKRVAEGLHHSVSEMLANFSSEPSRLVESAIATTPIPVDTDGPVERSPTHASGNSKKREKMPSTEALAESERMISLLLQATTKDSSHDRWSKLATELKLAGMQPSASPADAYTSLQHARRLGIQGEDLSLAIEAVDYIAARFEVDAYQLNLASVREFSSAHPDRRIDASQFNIVFTRLLLLTQHAVKANFFGDARELTRFCIERLEQSNNKETLALWHRLASQLVAAELKYGETSDAMRDVAFGTPDPASKYAAGQFFGFYKGDWDVGLPLLAECGNEEVEALASADLQGGSTPGDYVRLGDAWLRLSTKARPGIYRASAASRAAFWYEKVELNSAASLAKVYVDAKLKSLNTSHASSLQGTLEQLAERCKVDLTKHGLVNVVNNHRGAPRVGVVED